jgi:hypothetical protein
VELPVEVLACATVSETAPSGLGFRHVKNGNVAIVLGKFSAVGCGQLSLEGISVVYALDANLRPHKLFHPVLGRDPRITMSSLSLNFADS